MSFARTLSVCLLAAMALHAASPEEEAFIGSRRNWWSLQKPIRSDPPAIRDPWVRTPIDAFILEALRSKELAPSERLGLAQLIRRATLDLTGLPPTPEEVEAFLNDKSGDKYEKLIQRLQSSPHYGERWAQRWLDVV